MRIFYGFLILFASAVLFLVPYTVVARDFQVDVRTDEFFPATTGAFAIATNVTLGAPIFENDTTTVTLRSTLATDAPAVSSYNTTTRQLTITGLTVASNRTMAVLYDIDALAGNAGINTVVSRLPFVYLLMAIAFPGAAITAVWLGRA